MVLETPYDIRDEAMNDLLKSYSSNFAAKRKKFKMKFRSKKDQQQSIAILSKHWGKSKGVCTFLCKMKLAENLPAELHYDSRLVMNRLGEFYLCIPQPLEIWAKNQGPTQSDAVITLDPGVRTFITGYDPSEQAVEWGKNDISRIYRLSHIYDKIQSTHDSIHGKVHKRKRYKLCRVMLRIHKKICCLINDCHHKLAKWLCQSYRIILLPKFQTQGMVRHGKWRILREYPWCRVIICTEEYTSKTCGYCGHIHRKLGGSKVFRCPSCTAELDRDINGARNILLHYLTVTSKEPEYIGLIVGESHDEMKNCAKNGLNQITDKNYRSSTASHIEMIVEVTIVLCKKSTFVFAQLLQRKKDKLSTHVWEIISSAESG
ncbi:hypothetical protein Glove_267g56 [Diversispora epigaea]|uniref:Cas12f1-like TNB domain-containing protein n=1 Tax=Diversispora epigaea TaxID=1348612 RepID=A0A397I514_9GLOM|nr:hypothetical protein Glove_267g56 [Diversispora epigaea]